jgi:hypothetical protein
MWHICIVAVTTAFDTHQQMTNTACRRTCCLSSSDCDPALGSTGGANLGILLSNNLHRTHAMSPPAPVPASVLPAGPCRHQSPPASSPDDKHSTINTAALANSANLPSTTICRSPTGQHAPAGYMQAQAQGNHTCTRPQRMCEPSKQSASINRWRVHLQGVSRVNVVLFQEHHYLRRCQALQGVVVTWPGHSSMAA